VLGDEDKKEDMTEVLEKVEEEEEGTKEEEEDSKMTFSSAELPFVLVVLRRRHWSRNLRLLERWDPA
jgi:hypothetical protein